jgi:YgiT-type zinc finger domain-containing protein
MDYCEYCNSDAGLVDRLITVCRHRQGQHFIFEHVPARVCPMCGERYFSADVVQEMERLMASPQAQTHTIPVPLIAFGTAG